MSLNPYASWLGERDAVEVISATPGKLSQLAKLLGPQGLERSLGPAKWSARSIICHLADCEVVFGYRLRQTLAEPHHVIQPFDQDLWARPYTSLAAEEALQTFSSVRRWNLALMRRLGELEWAKPVNHPERGGMTFKTIVETMAGHDLNHLQQLEKIASAPAR